MEKIGNKQREIIIEDKREKGGRKRKSKKRKEKEMRINKEEE